MAKCRRYWTAFGMGPMTDPAYAAHEILVAPARRRPELWRLLAGLILAAVVAMILNRVAYMLLALLVPGLFAAGAPAFALGNSPLSLLVLLGSFGFVLIGVAVAAWLLQGRSVAGLIGPMPLALRQFRRVALALLGVGGLILILPPYDMGTSLTLNLAPGLWLALLPLSLLAVLIQTGTEEVLFRGNLQQSLAARFNHRVVWMGVPAAVFAFGHYAPAEAGGNALLIALWAGLFGLMSADLTARAGTLGPAIAVHLFNNAAALLVVALPDSLSGLALYTLPYALSDTGALRAWLAVDFAMMAVGWLAARLAIGR